MAAEAVRRLTPVAMATVVTGAGTSAPRNERDEAVSRLFDEHYRGLCRLAGLLLGDSAAAEEVVQEAFLRTFSGWWRVRHPERAQWYLKNHCRQPLQVEVAPTDDRGSRQSRHLVRHRRQRGRGRD